MKLLKIIFADDVNNKDNCSSELYGSLFFAIISAFLTVFNIINDQVGMSISSAVLIVGFVLAFLSAFYKKKTMSRIVISIICVVVFSYFALSGGNDGFSILWILLVPIISSHLLGLKFGFMISLYFQVFLTILFYTPLSVIIEDYYSKTFILRFPILYFSTFGVITFLMCQLKNLYMEIQKQSYYDDLTGIHNRRYYNEYCRNIGGGVIDPDLVIFSMDLSRLKLTNDTLGHEAGDELIREAARLISEAFCGDVCCRTGGDEFTVISTRKDAVESVGILKEKTSAWCGELIRDMNISVGYASHRDHPEISLEELAKAADKEMYANKSAFYISSGFDRRTH